MKESRFHGVFLMPRVQECKVEVELEVNKGDLSENTKTTSKSNFPTRLS